MYNFFLFLDEYHSTCSIFESKEILATIYNPKNYNMCPSPKQESMPKNYNMQCSTQYRQVFTLCARLIVPGRFEFFCCLKSNSCFLGKDGCTLHTYPYCKKKERQSIPSGSYQLSMAKVTLVGKIISLNICYCIPVRDIVFFLIHFMIHFTER